MSMGGMSMGGMSMGGMSMGGGGSTTKHPLKKGSK
jgi:hypothetical protein